MAISKDELVEILDKAIEGLRLNKSLVDGGLLESLTDLLGIARENRFSRRVLASLLKVSDAEVDDFLDKGHKLVELERKLIQSGLTEKLIDSMIDLKRSPVKLSLLAGML